MASKEETTVRTDTSIATDKITTITADTSTTSMRPVRDDDDDEKSLEGVLSSEEHQQHQFPDIPDFTPPLRIHATRVPERLTGSHPTLQIPPSLSQQMRRRKSEPSSSRSGSRSPGNFDGGSSISSLEDAGIDGDILTDKMGLLELDFREQQMNDHKLNKSCSSLPPVSERLSDETLEDSHAFTDLKREGNVSRGNSITTGGEVSSNMLEPLDEVDDEDENDGGKVKITNMEEILEVADEDAVDVPTVPTS